MNKLTAVVLSALLLLALTSCGNGNGIEPPVNGDLPESSSIESPSAPFALPSGVGAGNYPAVDGSTANIPLMARLYGEICGVPREEAETMVQASGGTGAVWRNMMWDGADLLLVYEAPDNIKAEMRDMELLDRLEIVPIGRDGLVFLVNSQNPVDSITREQLIGIYTGKITDWSELGGESGPIAAFQRNFESGSQTLFLGLLMKDTEPMEPPTELRPAGMGALIDAVAEYDGSGGAIGFSVYYYANLMYENPNLKLLAVDGVEPTAESIRDGSYPLVNDFYAVIRNNEPEDSPSRVLRDWLLTADGKRLLTDEGYIPVD